MSHTSRVFFFVFVVFVGGAHLTGCGSAPVPAPTSYASFNSKGGTFELEYPDGWTAAGGGGRGPEWAKFESGPASIRVNADVTGGLMGDIASLGGGDEEMMRPEDAPVHSIHVDGKEMAADEYSGYSEIGNPAELVVRLGPARFSEFTASSTFGSGLHGYRVTVLGHDKRVIVYCVCPESDWATLKPAFDHCLSTLVRGHAEL